MPHRTIQVKAPLFMRHKGVRVYHVYRHDDADSGVLRQYAYTLDPVNGSDEETDGVTTFDVGVLPDSLGAYPSLKEATAKVAEVVGEHGIDPENSDSVKAIGLRKKGRKR